MFKMTLIVFIINKVICVCLLSYNLYKSNKLLFFCYYLKKGKLT